MLRTKIVLNAKTDARMSASEKDLPVADFVVYLGNSTTYLNVHIIHKKGARSRGTEWGGTWPPRFWQGEDI